MLSTNVHPIAFDSNASGLMTSSELQQRKIQALRAEVRRLEGAGPLTDAERLSTGCPAWDRRLPGGGLARGTLVELLGMRPGGGLLTLALTLARGLVQQHGGGLLLLDPRGEFYPPAAAALGLDLTRLALVQPRRREDFVWAIEQGLRSPGTAVVLAEVERIESRAFRRWQLAAEQGGALGLLLRPRSAQGEPTWSDLQLLVETLPARRAADSPRPTGGRRFGIQPLRSRRGLPGRELTIEIDERTAALREIADAPGALPASA